MEAVAAVAGCLKRQQGAVSRGGYQQGSSCRGRGYWSYLLCRVVYCRRLEPQVWPWQQLVAPALRPPGAPQQPGIDALMAALMSDVRGWGPGLKGGAGVHGGRRGAGSHVAGSSSSSSSKVLIGVAAGSPTRALGPTGGIAAAGGRVGSPGALTRGPC